MNIPIFCINLESSIERKAFIQKEWIDKYGFDIKFWKAITKNDSRIQILDPFSQRLNRMLHLEEIALILSTIDLLQYCINQNLYEVIIMEDDIFPNPIFQYIYNKELPKIVFDYIKKCVSEYPNINILLMHRIDCENRFSIQEEKEYCYLTYTPPYGAQMNYYSLNGIHKTLETLTTMKYLVDEYPKTITDICLTKCPIAYHYEIKSKIKNPKYTSDIRSWVNKK